MITSQKASEITLAMCKFMLAGPNFFMQQMGDPSLTWQSNLCFGNFLVSFDTFHSYKSEVLKYP